MTKAREDLSQGLIVKGVGGLYYAQGDDGGEYVLRAKGIFRRQGVKPMVGDRIAYTPGAQDEHGWVEEILPRSNVLRRPPVANIATLILVIAPEPSADLLLLDTMLVMAREQSVPLAIVVNKCDLSSSLGAEIRQSYAHSSTQVLEVSAKSGQGLEELRAIMRRGICCFAGQSGVGKSTLLSATTGLTLQTGEISRKIARGKHTTRHAELMTSGEYCVLDTAGFSLLELWDNLEPIELKTFYPEFEPYEGCCKFAPCYHLSEPGCAVLEAMEKGELSADRVGRYHALLKKAQKAWRERYE